MDNRASCEESSLELVRELLITISYSVTDKNLDSVAFEKSNTEDEAVAKNTDEAVAKNTDEADNINLLSQIDFNF